ncbi:MAG: DUF2283 domain-containing protein [Bacteroidota bacterium]|nr:DUF2283 domain-containing protein [Bacteroidota bacterium]MDP4234067.1 DUF2283 domain-containing protein [Bacteroidota bacterium]MDP4243008.1 DUF2283 domain-containing protein [Bacteroidota bacterium]MDP4287434.1 DUF2283 domain-containing protein [Bacteroidota bacterium]
MKVTYFDDTDTLLVEFADTPVEDTRDLDANTLGEYDREGNLVAITLEHASKRADIRSFSYSNPAQVAA